MFGKGSKIISVIGIFLGLVVIIWLTTTYIKIAGSFYADPDQIARGVNTTGTVQEIIGSTTKYKRTKYNRKTYSARIAYTFEGKDYTAVLICDPSLQEGEKVSVMVDPENPDVIWFEEKTGFEKLMDVRWVFMAVTLVLVVGVLIRIILKRRKI